jgi:hypothetical protein
MKMSLRGGKKKRKRVLDKREGEMSPNVVERRRRESGKKREGRRVRTLGRKWR